MGLDMYLNRIAREVIPFANRDVNEIKTNDPGLYKKVMPYIEQRGDPAYFRWESFYEEIGYWRKANQIHSWFVQNVQAGVDDCDYHEVTPEQLRELRDLCARVVDGSVMVYGAINNGYSFDGKGNWVATTRLGKVILNPEIAAELLPTASGFFFGGTDYDEYYMTDIVETIIVIDRVLEDTDFSTHAIYYRSSW